MLLHLITVKFEARLENETVVGKSDGVEFTVKEGKNFLRVFFSGYIVH